MFPSQLSLPSGKKICAELTAPAHKLINKRKYRDYLAHPSEANLKQIRSPLRQVEIAADYCGLAGKNIKVLHKIEDECGDLKDKLRRDGRAAGDENKGSKLAAKLDQVYPLKLSCHRGSPLSSMEQAQGEIKRALQKNLSESQFHHLRVQVRELMLLHRAAYKATGKRGHKQVANALEKVSEEMGKEHDGMVDGQGGSTELTSKQRQILEEYVEINLK